MEPVKEVDEFEERTPASENLNSEYVNIKKKEALFRQQFQLSPIISPEVNKTSPKRVEFNFAVDHLVENKVSFLPL